MLWYNQFTQKGCEHKLSHDNIIIPELLPPAEDGVFRTLMTNPNAEPILRDVIESFLHFPVTKVEVKNAEMPISDINEKRERFDVNCSINDGTQQADVEMQADAMKGDSQKTEHKIIKSRAIYNLCDLHSGQTGRGITYDKLMRSYQMMFCGYTVFPERNDFVSRFSFRDEEGKELLDTVGIIFIELTKLKEIISKPINDMSGEEQWSLFFAFGGDLNYLDLMDRLESARKEIKMARELLSTISQDENERARFRSRRMFQMDMEHDRAVTRDERSMEIAKNMLKLNMAVELIAQVTGLTIAEVEALRKDI